MATDSKPWIVEYAKSGRAGCKGGCKGNIAKDELRIGRIIQAKNFDGSMPVWHHADCLFKKPRLIKSLEEVEGVEKLRWEDMKKVRDYIEGASQAADSSIEHPTGGGAEGPFLIENAKSSRVTCKGCDQKIEKGELRVSNMVQSESVKFRGKVPVWQHVKCFLEAGLLDYPVEDLPGWDKLNDEDRSKVLDLAKLSQKSMETDKQKSSKRKTRSQDEGSIEGSKDKQAAADKKNTEESVGKRLRSKETEDVSLSSEKAEENIVAPVRKKKGRPRKIVDKVEEPKHPAADSEYEKLLEEQSKAIWAIKDNLQKQVTTTEMKTMLIANDQDPTGSENDLRERCADGMLFGVLDKCPMCSSFMDYQGGPYKCKGFLTAYTKCNFSTFAPKRLKDEWKVPDDIDNEYLLQWKKSPKVTAERLYLPASTKEDSKASGKSSSTKEAERSSSAGPMAGVTLMILGRLSQSQAKWKELIEKAGGRLVSILNSDTKYVVVNENDLERHKDKLQQARTLKIPILKEAFLTDWLEQKNGISVESYAIEIPAAASLVKVKVKGRSAVHEDSGLQEKGHILEEGNTIYNTTLNLSDLNSNKNSYYILQIIEEDGNNAHHLFRKWGRVGSKRSKKSERFSKATAISEFKRLFLEKTGNEWDSWQQRDNFKKHPGKYYPLEIDHGIDDEPLGEQPPMGSRSKLDSQVVDLMKLLFDMETYRAAMLEYEINVDEMPLGKLSKRYIQQGFEVLTEIQNILASDSLPAERKDSALKDASNRFFTLIPAIDPHVIATDNELRSKIEMLEALRDMEIASTLINTKGDISEEDPLDTHYRKLHCDIAPLPHNSSQYVLVKRYLERTHASSHKDWALELEDVFVVNREGEDDKFEPYKKMGNHMLLWHGSRTTNFVGILSQGLRIAPPEAPATGYMFGKGIYFADLVSKSAQYCYTSKNNPTGLMLLCEVALGKMNELKSAQYMEKPPKGTHSTKGLGRTKPEETEFEKFRGDVTVPCGRPVASGVRGTELLYNEYIVYDSSQVKARFLLKVRFKHK